MDRKEVIRRHREAPQPAGVYLIRHQPSGRGLLGASPNAPAMLNRIRAQLEMGTQPIRQMQQDWDDGGASEFGFEVLDLLDLSDDNGADLSDELQTLLQMWQELLSREINETY